jgi:hypothetical protein
VPTRLNEGSVGNELPSAAVIVVPRSMRIYRHTRDTIIARVNFDGAHERP